MPIRIACSLRFAVRAFRDFFYRKGRKGLRKVRKEILFIHSVLSEFFAHFAVKAFFTAISIAIGSKGLRKVH